MSSVATERSLSGRRIVFADFRPEGLDLVPEHDAYTTRIANALADRGADVVVLCRSAAPWRGLHRDLPVVSLRRLGVRRALMLLRARFDVVIDVEASSPWISSFAARAGAAPIVLVQHEPLGAPRRPGLRGFVRQVALRKVHRQSCIVVTGGSLRRAVRKDLGLRGPVRVIPGASTGASGPLARAARPTIVCLAVPAAGFQVDRLLRAIPTVIGEFPDLRVEILGDGAERPALEHLAYGLGVESAVHFAGRVPPARQQELLASAWLAVDPLGSAPAIEAAMRAGVPVVAAARRSTADLVHEAGTGWVFHHEHELGDRLLAAMRTVADPVAAATVSKRLLAGRVSSWDECAAGFASVVSSEVQRNQVPQRRRWSDVTAVATWSSASASSTIELLEQRLRGTDRWSADGDSFTVLLYDCDEVDAINVLADLRVYQADLHIAGRDDLALVGTARM